MRQVHRGVTLVAGEAFVAAISVEGDGNVLARLAGNVVAGDRGRISERFTVVLDEHGQDFHGIWPHDEFVMIGAHVLGDASRVMQFTEILFLKTNGKGFDAFGRFLGHQGNDGA